MFAVAAVVIVETSDTAAVVVEVHVTKKLRLAIACISTADYAASFDAEFS